MGGLIPLGVYIALTGEMDWLVLYKTIPMMLIVTQFMLLNNTCDMDRDSFAGRKTLPILIGRQKAQKVANALSVIWVLQLLHVVLVWYTYGIIIIVGMLAIIWKNYRLTFKIKRSSETKIPATMALVPVTMGIAVAYPLAIAVQLLFH